MSQQQGGFPSLGATFTPGGGDDFYMPEVISPAPQRIMPEVPGNMQEKMAQLELEANPSRQSIILQQQHQQQQQIAPRHGSQGNIQYDQRDNGTYSQQDYNGRRPSADNLPQAQTYRHEQKVYQGPPQKSLGYQQYERGPELYSSNPPRDRQSISAEPPLPDLPSFSPFPRLHNPPPNVPPSDDEREATLEQARLPVLNSNDPEMQLAWAQDALSYVEVAIQHELRISEIKSPRPQTPQVEHQLRVDAISVVSFLAEQHHPKAEFMKGMWLEFGKFGFRVDKKEAFRCYKRAADLKYARAEYRIGMQYEASNEPQKAITHYEQGVALGDSASNYRLGMMALLGQHGQKQDYGRGVNMIRFAAQHADENAPQGAYVYGMLLGRELPNISIPEMFLPVDLNAARTNIEKAAYLGFAKAQQKMGIAYELCQLGCDFNPALSLHYNALAARQGEPEAEMAISKWFLCGYDGIFEKNEELAYVYAQRAAQSGLATAEFAMGYFHEIGMYVPQNLEQAQIWYETAAKHGNKDAAGRIEGLARSNTLTKKDHEDVAIARIRSQYGSQRGKRPDRTKITAPQLAPITDDRIDMPDPSTVSTKNPALANAFDDSQVPARPTSVAPYPLEDGPPDNPNNGPRRPSSFINPNLIPQPQPRPSSAFGINPNLRTNISGTPEPRQYSQPQYQNMANSQPMTRPHTSMDRQHQGPGYGRPNGYDMRTQSVGPGPPPANYRAPGSMAPGGPLQGGPPAIGLAEAKGQPPRLDIGFSAPPDPGPDRRARLQKPQKPPGPEKAQPPLPGQKQDVFSPPTSPMPPPKLSADGRSPLPSPASGRRTPAESPWPAHQNPLSPHQHSERLGGSRLSGSPGGGSLPGSRPGSAVGHQSRPETGGPPPPAKSGPAKPQGSANPAQPHVSRPGKGPKTFEEMGVPAAQKEHDCVVM